MLIRPIDYNFSSRFGNAIRFIVVHDTGNYRAGANAINHYKYFSGGNRNRSAHYFVDDREIVQIIDPKYAAWHCGDNTSRNGCNNLNSIGVELCVNSDSNRIAAKSNLIRLVHFLMIKYNIPPERVIRHYDVTGKLCPKSMIDNDWAEWKTFRMAI